jgi:hypothetical protein
MLDGRKPAELEVGRIRVPNPEFEDQSEIVTIAGRRVRHDNGLIVDL